jgi:hypothetical protein
MVAKAPLSCRQLCLDGGLLQAVCKIGLSFASGEQPSTNPAQTRPIDVHKGFCLGLIGAGCLEQQAKQQHTKPLASISQEL